MKKSNGADGMRNRVRQSENSWAGVALKLATGHNLSATQPTSQLSFSRGFSTIQSSPSLIRRKAGGQAQGADRARTHCGKGGRDGTAHQPGFSRVDILTFQDHKTQAYILRWGFRPSIRVRFIPTCPFVT